MSRQNLHGVLAACKLLIEMSTHRYADRRAAGRELARVLWAFAAREPVIVALDHGGVRVAFEVATALDAPLATDSTAYDVVDRTVIVVHDGVATERIVRKALRSLRLRGAKQLVLATPVGQAACLARLSADADEIVCTRATGEWETPSDWYDDESHGGCAMDTHPEEIEPAPTLAQTPPPKKKRGFAAMDRAKVQAIARLGGVAAHRYGTAHRFTGEEARVAGRKGGLAPHDKRGRGTPGPTAPA